MITPDETWETCWNFADFNETEWPVQKVFTYHDFPHLFIRMAPDGTPWLFWWVDSNDEERDGGGLWRNQWAVLRLSVTRFLSMMSGQVLPEDARDNPETFGGNAEPELYLVTTNGTDRVLTAVKARCREMSAIFRLMGSSIFDRPGP